MFLVEVGILINRMHTGRLSNSDLQIWLRVRVWVRARLSNFKPVAFPELSTPLLSIAYQQRRRLKEQDWCDSLLSKAYEQDLKSRTCTQSRIRTPIRARRCCGTWEARKARASSSWLPCSSTPGALYSRGGGADSHIKVTGVLVGFFESDP